MPFTVEGIIGDEPVLIDWDDGEFETDPETTILLEIEMKRPGQLPIPEMVLGYNETDDPLAFLFLTFEVLDEVISVSGDVPTLPKTPTS